MTLIHLRDEAFTDKHWQAYYSLMEHLLEKYQSPMARVGWPGAMGEIKSWVPQGLEGCLKRAIAGLL